jgi:multiple sugar transport system permease protein
MHASSGSGQPALSCLPFLPVGRGLAAKLRRWAPGYLFILPAVVVLTVMTVYPSLNLIRLSLTDWKLTGDPKFVGLRNFVAFFQLPASWRVLYVTVLFLAWDVIIVFGIGLAVALALNQRIRFRGFFRAAVLIPWTVTAVVAGVVWRWMLLPEVGVITYLLSLVHVQLEFLLNPTLSLVSVILVDAWRSVGYAAVFLLAGLQSIDPSLYEAARVDGAGACANFRRITMPLLAPSGLVLLILLTIHALNTVDVILIVTGGGPMRLTETTAFHMYKEALYYFNVGYGSAVAVFLLIANIGLAILYFRLLPGGAQEAA